MTTSYSPITQMRNPAEGDWQWHGAWWDNVAIVEFVLGGLVSRNRIQAGGDITPAGGLDITIMPAHVVYNQRFEQLQQEFNPTISLSPPAPGEVEARNWVYSISGNVFFQVATSPPQREDYIPFGVVDTDANGILRVADLRLWLAGVRSAGIFFTQNHLMNGIFTMGHGLGTMYPALVTVFDDTMQRVRPSSVGNPTLDTVDIDLSAFEPIQGQWRVEVRS